MIATRPWRATLRAKERPAMPLPSTKKSKALSLMRSNLRVIDQPRFTDEYRQGDLRACRHCWGRFQRFGVKKLDIIDLRIGILFDELLEVLFESCRFDRRGRGIDRSFG